MKFGEELTQPVEEVFFWSLRVQRSQSRCGGVRRCQREHRRGEGERWKGEKGKLQGRKIFSAELEPKKPPKNCNYELTVLEGTRLVASEDFLSHSKHHRAATMFC